MRVQIDENMVRLWLSANDTFYWARRPGQAWPCSEISGRRLFAEFDWNGLLDLTVDGRHGVDIPASEFNAITSDFLSDKLPREHPAWYVAVGQFQDEST